MRTLVDIALWGTLASFALVICASTALAHCFPDRSTPPAASVVDTAPSQVVVHFDNPFNPTATNLRVLNEAGNLVSSAGLPSSDDRSMVVQLKAVSAGQYFVKWRATSQDGDHTMGGYSFTVKGTAH